MRDIALFVSPGSVSGFTGSLLWVPHDRLLVSKCQALRLLHFWDLHVTRQ